MKLTQTHLKYLVTILQLSQQTPNVSSVQIARQLSVTRPSVAKMLGVLAEKGLIEKAFYGKIVLTPQGIEVAQRYQKVLSDVARLIPGLGLELTSDEVHQVAEALAEVLPERLFGASA